MILDFFNFQKKLDTIEDHHSKHTIEDQGCSWTTPLKNWLDDVFLLGFNKGIIYFGKLGISENSKRMKLRK